MVCPGCSLKEKVWCVEYGLPRADHKYCWVTGELLTASGNRELGKEAT